MWGLYGNKKMRVNLTNRERVFCAVLILVGFFLIASASSSLLAKEREYSAARSEYTQLRELYASTTSDRHTDQQTPQLQEIESYMAAQPPDFSPLATPNLEFNSVSPDQISANPDIEIYADPQEQVLLNPIFESQIANSVEAAEPRETITDLAELNPDYIGWITIEGVVDYPVVRGHDNSRYLYRTYTGQRNSSGTIFMDYRNTQGFFETVCILYGHNMRDGSMFAPLKKYIDPSFLAANSEITVTTSAGELLTYRIFAVKQTDVWDNIYDLGFTDATMATNALNDAPEGMGNFLLLSTCTNSAEKDDRLLVYAAAARSNTEKK